MVEAPEEFGVVVGTDHAFAGVVGPCPDGAPRAVGKRGQYQDDQQIHHDNLP